jgi:hypothetical protein
MNDRRPDWVSIFCRGRQLSLCKCIQTGHENHPDSCLIGMGGGVNATEVNQTKNETDHSTASSAGDENAHHYGIMGSYNGNFTLTIYNLLDSNILPYISGIFVVSSRKYCRKWISQICSKKKLLLQMHIYAVVPPIGLTF